MRPIMIDFPLPIVTPRLLLRQPIMGYIDADEYTEAVAESINELSPWIPWAQYVPTVNQSEEYIRECSANWITKSNNNIGLSLWITDRVTGVFLGHIVMWNIAWDVPKFEFGFWIRTSCEHKGYITEATNALTRYCFLQHKARRIEIYCDPKNVRSQMVPERLRFQLEKNLHSNTSETSNSERANAMVFSRIDLTNLPELEVTWSNTTK